MADKLYKVGEEIELSYQAPNKQSGLSGVVAEIFLPNGQKDSGFPDVALTEIGTTGNYKGIFTPDAQGTWRVLMHKSDGGGQVPKAYSVGAKNIQDIYVDTAKDSTVAKDATVAKEATVAKDNTVAKEATLTAAEASINTNVDNAESAIRGSDSDTLKTLSDQIDDVDNKVSSLDTPPVAY